MLIAQQDSKTSLAVPSKLLQWIFIYSCHYQYIGTSDFRRLEINPLCIAPIHPPLPPTLSGIVCLKVLCTYLLSCSVDQLVEGIHYMAAGSVEFEHFLHCHICVPLPRGILRSCFPVARSYLNMRLFFYLHSCLAVGFFSVLYLKINCCYLNFASM